jgi:hypothetical protein
VVDTHRHEPGVGANVVHTVRDRFGHTGREVASIDTTGSPVAKNPAAVSLRWPN